MINTISEGRGCKNSACAPSELQIGANYDAPAAAQRLSHSRKEVNPDNSSPRRSDLQHLRVISY
jgi:hypothetical protein